MFVRIIKVLWYRTARAFCLLFCKVFFRLRATGTKNIPKKGAFLLVCNHQSYLDPVFCGVSLRRDLYFLARDSLFRNPFFGRVLLSVNVIPVRRDEADLSAMRKVISKLKDGNGVLLFPESTRTRDGRISDFKAGLGLLCRRGGAAVVPVVIDGAFDCWPRHKKIFRAFKKIVVSYGECISADEIKKMDKRELARRLNEIMRGMHNDCRRRLGKEAYNYE